jgi:hypothetical protein
MEEVEVRVDQEGEAVKCKKESGGGGQWEIGGLPRALACAALVWVGKASMVCWLEKSGICAQCLGQSVQVQRQLTCTLKFVDLITTRYYCAD